jgi:dihydrodipicolinate synthase/N-acetylneuraminate lyase
MKISPILDSEFAATVMAVPPLARRADYSLDAAENQKLIRHIEAGGVRTLLYGGNANLYHVAVSEYRELLDMLAESAGPDTRVIPAIGADYGKMLDQARILAQTSYRTAMVLPLALRQKRKLRGRRHARAPRRQRHADRGQVRHRA